MITIFVSNLAACAPVNMGCTKRYTQYRFQLKRLPTLFVDIGCRFVFKQSLQRNIHVILWLTGVLYYIHYGSIVADKRVGVVPCRFVYVENAIRCRRPEGVKQCPPARRTWVCTAGHAPHVGLYQSQVKSVSWRTRRKPKSHLDKLQQFVFDSDHKKTFFYQLPKTRLP